jgi:LmbE family N-acetylglucosaminyl deacetylase
MPSALLLSPHLDDAAFSCGGLAARLAAQGWRVTLATLFTATVPNPRGFALHTQTSKGIPPHVDYMALRRREDIEAGRHLGVSRVVHLPLPEAPHRGYGGPDALFGNVLPYDEIDLPLADHLHRLAADEQPDLVLLPLGIGGHVDHRIALRAAMGAGLPGVHAFWRDAPYVMRPTAVSTPAPEAPAAPWTVAAEVTDFMPQRIAACAAYRSQLGYQFDGEGRMAEALGRYARHEAETAGLHGRAAEIVACVSKRDAEFVQHALVGDGGGGERRPARPAPAGPPQSERPRPAPPRNLPDYGAPPSRPVQPSPEARPYAASSSGDGHARGLPGLALAPERVGGRVQPSQPRSLAALTRDTGASAR